MKLRKKCASRELESKSKQTGDVYMTELKLAHISRDFYWLNKAPDNTIHEHACSVDKYTLKPFFIKSSKS